VENADVPGKNAQERSYEEREHGKLGEGRENLILILQQALISQEDVAGGRNKQEQRSRQERQCDGEVVLAWALSAAPGFR